MYIHSHIIAGESVRVSITRSASRFTFHIRKSVVYQLPFLVRVYIACIYIDTPTA